MAEVQRPPTLPTSLFLGRPDPREFGRKFSTGQKTTPSPTSSHAYKRTRYLPPVQLPPIQTNRSPHADDSRSRPLTHSVSSSPITPPRFQANSSRHQPTFHRPTAARRQETSYQSRDKLQGVPKPFMNKKEEYPCARDVPRHHNSLRFPTSTRRSPTASTSPDFPSKYNADAAPSSTVSLSPPGYQHAKPNARIVCETPPLDYILSIRQQPVAARACGYGERDRRVIDPPPILDIKITDRATGEPEQDPNAMLALHCTLLSADGQEDQTEQPPTHQDMMYTRLLMGTLVASPYPGKDENGISGMFFVFSDLSCRKAGTFRLRFKLLRVDPTHLLPGAVHAIVGNIVSDVFTVYPAKDFPGMRASSSLLMALRTGGLSVGIKKGSVARKEQGKGRPRESNSAESSSNNSSSESGDDPRPAAMGATGATRRSRSRKSGKRRREKQ